jgi:hypothetical protein
VSDLRDATGQLYRVFQRYRRPESIDFCDHCQQPESFGVLLTGPLKALRPHDLDVYVSSVLDTCGSIEDFRHYLPRILELLPESLFTIGPEGVLNKLGRVGWEGWPPDERSAIETYLWAHWRRERRNSERAGEALCALAQALTEVGPLLAEWLLDGAPDAVSARVQFVLKAVPQVSLRGHLSNAYWRTRPEQEREVIDWLRSAQVVADAPADDDAGSLAIQVLANYQRASRDSHR